MGYQVNNSNSKKFTVDGVQYALACIPDPDISGIFTVGIFFKTSAGDWNCPVGADYNGIIDDNVTTEKIMAAGSVALYIQSILPLASGKVAKILNIAKPALENKGACVGYDFVLDVDFNSTSNTFSLNKQPPLSHAR